MNHLDGFIDRTKTFVEHYYTAQIQARKHKQ
jgi:hypothetical protein